MRYIYTTSTFVDGLFPHLLHSSLSIANAVQYKETQNI